MDNSNFIPYEEACEIRELGFAEECFAGYEGKPKRLNFGKYPANPMYVVTNAPLYQQAFKFFRKKYGFNSVVISGSTGDPIKKVSYSYEIKDSYDEHYPDSYGNNWWFEHEEAELACLRELIEIVNTKKDS